MSGTTKQVRRLRDQIHDVRESILDAVVRMDEIKLWQIPRIQANYALKLGGLEQELLEAEVSCRRSERRLALAQAQAVQSLAPQMERIERELDAEFADWRSEVTQARKDYERALAFPDVSLALTSAKAAKLRDLYRRLAKRLHPDIRGGENRGRTTLFLLAQTAYQNGAADALRSLETATHHLDLGDKDLETNANAEDLAQEYELALIEDGVVRERLQELEECDEMRLGRLLCDPDWVRARTAELRRSIEARHRMQSDCEQKLRSLLGGSVE